MRHLLKGINVNTFSILAVIQKGTSEQRINVVNSKKEKRTKNSFEKKEKRKKKEKHK